jgi:uncharacterized protein with HEPN domain
LTNQKFSSMNNEVKTWLKDIEQAITEINSFIPEIKNFKDFQKDLRTKRAVERNIEIIGEAISRILKTDSNIKISHSRKIVDTRNRIIHGYDTVSEDILWGIIIRNLTGQYYIADSLAFDIFTSRTFRLTSSGCSAWKPFHSCRFVFRGQVDNQKIKYFD